MELNKRLKDLRKGSNLTQKQLADRIGVAKSVISYYEHGDRLPSYDVLIKLSRIFHVTTDYLLGLDHKKTIDVSHLTDAEVAAVISIVDVISNKKD